MRSPNPAAYTFVLPRSFSPADYLPLRLATRADDANWLVSTIVRKTSCGESCMPIAGPPCTELR